MSWTAPDPWSPSRPTPRAGPIEPLELTQEQWDLAKATFPEAAPETPRPIFCVPVHVVERVEDSTPFKLWLEKVKAEYAEATTVPFPEIGAQWGL